jgi:cobalt-zinc-cadmium efflux system membrane fusion protein
VDINEKDLSKVHRGQAAIVTIGAFPDLKLKGRITYIADLVDQSTRTVKARIEVANPGRKMKPEMFATVELALAGDAPQILAVPEDALQDLDGKKVVFVAENEAEFTARQVQTGRGAGGMIEIVSGLKEGERYAIKGSFILKSEIKKGEMKDEH